MLKKLILVILVSNIIFCYPSLSSENKYQLSLSDDETNKMKNYYDLGFQYSKDEKYQQSIEAFKKYIEINPNNDYIQYTIGIIYHEINENEKAVIYLNKALSLNSQNYNYHFALGDVLYSLGKYQEAVDALQKTIEIKPDFDKSYYNIAYILIKDKSLKEAVDYLEKCITINNKNEKAISLIKSISKFYLSDTNENNPQNIYSSLAKSLNLIGEYNSSIEMSKKGLGFYPKSTSLYLNLGGSYFVTNKIDDALNIYEKALSINSKDVQIYFFMAEAYKKKGDNDKAIESYNKIIDLEKDLKIHSNTYKKSYHYLGIIYDKKLMLEEATKAFRKSCELGLESDCKYVEVIDKDGKIKNLKDFPNDSVIKIE